MTKTTKFSHQRQIILEILKTSNSHLTAEEVFELARKVKKDISLATVYRNLHKLEEIHQLIKIHIPNNQPRYEAATEPHHHLVCTKCGTIEHINEPNIKTCHKCISNNNDFQVEKVISTVLGKCSKCSKKQ